MNLLRGLVFAKLDELEDPNMLIDQAMREMRSALERNRERVVQALTMRNKLLSQVKNAEAQIARNQQQATAALQAGQRDAALQFMEEKKINEATLVELKEHLAQCEEIVESAKTGIKQQEMMIRKKTAEALQQKAKWGAAQANNEIMKAMSQFNTDFTTEQNDFARAADKIDTKAGEAKARTEMYKDSFAGKVASMEQITYSQEAQNDLAALEASLGLGATTTVQPQEPTLEQRLGIQ